MVFDHAKDYGSTTAAGNAVSAQLGIFREALRRWDRLRAVYADILRRCEDHGVRTGWELPAEQRRDKGTASLAPVRVGHRAQGAPKSPAPERRRDAPRHLWTGGIGGQIDRPMATFAADAAAALATPRLSGKLAKLLRAPLPERHLYLRVEMSGLPFPSYDALLMAHGPPPGPPPLPDGNTHLWLMPALSRACLVRRRAVWPPPSPHGRGCSCGCSWSRSRPSAHVRRRSNVQVVRLTERW